MDGMADSAAADIARAEGLAGQAVAASPRSPRAHYAKGQVLRAQVQVLGAQDRCEEAITEYEAAIALDRNLVFPIAALGWSKFLTGSIEEVIPLVEQAVRLSPRDPAISIWYQWIGIVHLLQSHTDEAIVWLEKARNANPAHPIIRANPASAYGLKGETERCRGTRRSPEAEQRRSFFQHRPLEGRPIFRGAGRPCPVQSHLFRRPAQGRDAGGMTATRRLAAILAADVAGYSRLMGADEEGTHERLKAYHRELVDPKISEHSGRTVMRAALEAEGLSVIEQVDLTPTRLQETGSN
jgi:tetratricopeptide (TPR) repeat protein